MPNTNMLEGAFLAGINLVRKGFVRQWKGCTATGKTRWTKTNEFRPVSELMVEVIDPKVKGKNQKRWLNTATFKGTAMTVDGVVINNTPENNALASCCI